MQQPRAAKVRGIDAHEGHRCQPLLRLRNGAGKGERIDAKEVTSIPSSRPGLLREDFTQWKPKAGGGIDAIRGHRCPPFLMAEKEQRGIDSSPGNRCPLLIKSHVGFVFCWKPRLTPRQKPENYLLPFIFLFSRKQNRRETEQIRGGEEKRKEFQGCIVTDFFGFFSLN